MTGVGEPRLRGKGIAVEPLEKIAAIRPDHLELWRVQMRVDQSGRDQRVLRKWLRLYVIRELGLIPLPDPRDSPGVVHLETSILEVAPGRIDVARAERVGDRSEDGRTVEFHGRKCTAAAIEATAARSGQRGKGDFVRLRGGDIEPFVGWNLVHRELIALRQRPLDGGFRTEPPFTFL